MVLKSYCQLHSRGYSQLAMGAPCSTGVESRLSLAKHLLQLFRRSPQPPNYILKVAFLFFLCPHHGH